MVPAANRVLWLSAANTVSGSCTDYSHYCASRPAIMVVVCLTLVGLKYAIFIRASHLGVTLSLDWLCERPKAHSGKDYDISK